MKNTVSTMQESPTAFQVEPLLTQIMQEAEQEHQHLQQIFALMGWGDLPDALKIEIKDDVLAMVRELKGQYSSCDPFVMKRRQRVHYWVRAFQDNICSLQTAVDALKVTAL